MRTPTRQSAFTNLAETSSQILHGLILCFGLATPVYYHPTFTPAEIARWSNQWSDIHNTYSNRLSRWRFTISSINLACFSSTMYITLILLILSFHDIQQNSWRPGAYRYLFSRPMFRTHGLKHSELSLNTLGLSLKDGYLAYATSGSILQKPGDHFWSALRLHQTLTQQSWLIRFLR